MANLRPIAPLDRRVRILSEGHSLLSPVRLVSDLRSSPFVVLLGEPGIGKSTVLIQEAAHENVIVRTVRDLMTDIAPEAGGPLFIDALDEYRIDGSPRDKVHGLGRVMREAKAPRWRLTCRAEDWRKDADLAAIGNSTGGQAIVVAQLLPLSYEEAVDVLKSLGAADPDGFLAKAHALGAQSLLESPLSLKLLFKAVSNGETWPTTRHDVFAAAITRLAHEHNPLHKGGPRLPVPRIIEAAEKTCLVLLLSGRRAVWRSHDEPPAAGNDERAYLRGYELEIDDTLFRDMLDTSLFRGEGESFEPMHRTVAEYLAGRALAKAVSGDAKNAAIPLGRAIAMATGVDRKAPAELRGLYAWFAAHLAKSGRDDDARQLIDADAATVLAYGDAAVFPTPLRRAMLMNLDREDPFFRAGDHDRYTAVGGLAGRDLEKDFVEILDKGSDGTHRLLTVFEALTNGQPVEALRARLWDIALDPNRPEWQRRRAGDAWLNGAQHRTRALYDAICTTPASDDRESLRVHIASQLPVEALSVNDITSLVADFTKTKKTRTVGTLIPLARNLATVPQGVLFAVHAKTWLPKGALESHSVELEHFFDTLLAATIRGTADLTAAQVWLWARNSREGTWDPLHEKSRKALQEWLDADSTREAALLDIIIDGQDPSDRERPWIPRDEFTVLTQRLISAPLIRHVLATAKQMPVGDASKARLAVAVEMARKLKDEAETISQEILAELSNRPDCAELVSRLTSDDDAARTTKQAAVEAKRLEKRELARQETVRVLTPEIDEIRAGKRIDRLAGASRVYFEKQHGEPPADIGRVVSATNDEITAAIREGWNRLVTQGAPGVTATSMGQEVSSPNRLKFETAVLAGLEQLFGSEGASEPATCPLVVAIAVLNSPPVLHLSPHCKEIERWALNRLNAEPVSGAEHLRDFWVAAIDAGTNYIESFGRVHEDDAHGPAVVEALHSVLDTRRSMPVLLLRAALRAAGKRIELKRLLALAEAALADATVTGEQRQIWVFTAFLLDPLKYGDQILTEYGADGGARLHEDLRSHEHELIPTVDATARAEREALIVRMVGASHPPEDDELMSGEDRLSNADIARRAIQILPNYPEVEAGHALRTLIADPKLAAWKRSLQHSYAQWARVHRESTFRFPTPTAVLEVLSGRAPVNSADLLVVVMEELYRLRRELRTSDNTPWKRYWNTDSKGDVEKPRIENECRDHLLDRLRDRLERYKIIASLPESRRQEQTRADMLILSVAGKSLPIEVKRHYNGELWTAPSEQLQPYTLAEGSDGYGIYLVFWFGTDVGKLPGRKDKAELPETAPELEKMLIADLSPQDREQIRVIVFDVSKEAAGEKD